MTRGPVAAETRAAALCLALIALVGSETAQAGFLIAPSIRWSSFAARPEAGEPTPNYFGYGGALSLGYSFGQVFDLAAAGSYLPARLKQAAVDGKDATLIFYGAELGFRFADSVYLGLRGGPASYQLFKKRQDEELAGRWSGAAGGLSIGAVGRLSKQSFIQTCFEVMHTVMQRDKAPPLDDGSEMPDPGKRRFDAFALSVAYVHNGATSYKIENTIFRDFLDTLSFF